MNQFICTTCGCVDSLFATPQTTPGLQCAQCQDGEWHGLFPQRQYDPAVDGSADFINAPPTDPLGDGLTPSF